jgi:hypothetical protein
MEKGASGFHVRARPSTRFRMRGYEKFARGDSSRGSELKAFEEACREASPTVEPCELCSEYSFK